jgi:trehalose 6-phosphate synthase/phosphatase
LFESLGQEWKAQIRATLEHFVDTTPGSFIEEKDFSLAWHYRKVDPALRQARARELMGVLPGLLQKLPLVVREGKRVIEVKSLNVDKGRAIGEWLSGGKQDFLFAVGDDWTDEDLFHVLPAHAYSIKVGLGPSAARWHVAGQGEIAPLLKMLASSIRSRPPGKPTRAKHKKPRVAR